MKAAGLGLKDAFVSEGGCRTLHNGRTIGYRSGEAAIQDSLARRARSSDKKMISTESAFQGRLERGFRNHIESR
jgi:hypothetical protein